MFDCKFQRSHIFFDHIFESFSFFQFMLLQLFPLVQVLSGSVLGNFDVIVDTLSTEFGANLRFIVMVGTAVAFN
jgi:hypothetical protein